MMRTSILNRLGALSSILLQQFALHLLLRVKPIGGVGARRCVRRVPLLQRCDLIRAPPSLRNALRRALLLDDQPVNAVLRGKGATHAKRVFEAAARGAGERESQQFSWLRRGSSGWWLARACSSCLSCSAFVRCCLARSAILPSCASVSTTPPLVVLASADEVPSMLVAASCASAMLLARQRGEVELSGEAEGDAQLTTTSAEKFGNGSSLLLL